jgi:hypothetical protein
VEQLDSTSWAGWEVLADWGRAEERRTWGKRGERRMMEAGVGPFSEEDSTQEVRRKGEGALEEEAPGVSGTRRVPWCSVQREERDLKPTRAKATATGMEIRTRAHITVDFHWLLWPLPSESEPLLELESVQRMNTCPLLFSEELLSSTPRAARTAMGTSERKRAELVPETREPKAEWMEEEEEEEESSVVAAFTIFSSNHCWLEALRR